MIELMRSTYLACVLLAACGGNDVDPRTIPGGGIGDGEIDGEVNVTIIDDDDNPIANAAVRVGDVDKTTNETGVVTFEDVSGPQTIAVKADGHRQVVWVGADGANVTIPLEPLTTAVPEQATLTGTITGWDGTTNLPANTIRAAVIFYSQSDDLGDDANNLTTPGMGNICGVGSNTCNWTLVSRTGPITLIAAVIERDTKGTIAADDDTNKIVGWASRSGVTVQNGVGQTGLALTMVEAGNLEDVTIDFGTPPAGLTEVNALVGLEVGDDEVIQLPLFLNDVDQSTLLAPKPSVFSATGTYRLTGVAQTTMAGEGAQSIVLRRDNAGPALAAGDWLVPPTSVTVDHAGGSWDPVAGAKVQQLQYRDANDNIVVEVTTFDNSSDVTLPSLIELPAGTLTAQAAGLGATLDVHDFSLEEDEKLVFAIAAQPATVQ